MKKTAVTIALIGLVTTIALTSPAEAKTFKTCNELRKTYKYGVALSNDKAKKQEPSFHSPKISANLYNQNKKLDTDKDGVVCELKMANSDNDSAKALPSEGKVCLTAGERRTSFDRTYTCVVSASKKTWSRGELNVNHIYSTDDGYLHARSNYCFIDPDAGAEWAKFQTYIRNEVRRCPYQLRFLTYEMGKKTPTTNVSTVGGPTQPCKAASPSRGSWVKGFEDPERRLEHNVLGRNSVMQIIPIYAPDTARPVNSPAVDYSKYLNFVKKFVSEVSDLPVNFEIRIPDKYFEFSKPLKPYGVSHKLPSGHPTALKDIMSEIDQHIDFTGATTALVLVPAETAQNVWQQGPLGYYRSSEAILFGVSAQYPATEKLLSAAPEFLNLSVPAWWVHEFYHLGVGMDDHYGKTQENSRTLTGMGFWGLMNPGITDMLGWEKWILDYIADSQVACIEPTNDSQTIWLRPSAVNTTQQKLAVVPISSSKVLVVESIRGAGLNHHLMPKEQGLLVYSVDTANKEHGFGFDLIYPASRQTLNGTFPGSLAPLQAGESVEINNVLIKVVEAGNFGDIVSITRVR